MAGQMCQGISRWHVDPYIVYAIFTFAAVGMFPVVRTSEGYDQVNKHISGFQQAMTRSLQLRVQVRYNSLPDDQKEKQVAQIPKHLSARGKAGVSCSAQIFFIIVTCAEN